MDVPGGGQIKWVYRLVRAYPHAHLITQAAVGTGRSVFDDDFALNNDNILQGVIVPPNSTLGVGFSVLTDVVNGGARNYWINCGQIAGMADIGGAGSSAYSQTVRSLEETTSPVIMPIHRP